MESSDRQRVRFGRITGGTALVLAGLFVASIFLGPGNVLHGHTDNQTAISYAAGHAVALSLLGFADGMINTLFGILIVLLVALATGTGVLARIAYVSAAAAAGIQWVHAGMLYGLADLAQRGGADAGVLALFTLGSTMDDADGIVIPIAMVCAGWLLLRSDRVPRFVPWVTFAAAAAGAVVTVLAAAGGPDLGPVSVVSAWIWLLVTGVTLLARPARDSDTVPARSAAAAQS